MNDKTWKETGFNPSIQLLLYLEIHACITLHSIIFKYSKPAVSFLYNLFFFWPLFLGTFSGTREGIGKGWAIGRTNP